MTYEEDIYCTGIAQRIATAAYKADRDALQQVARELIDQPEHIRAKMRKLWGKAAVIIDPE